MLGVMEVEPMGNLDLIASRVVAEGGERSPLLMRAQGRADSSRSRSSARVRIARLLLGHGYGVVRHALRALGRGGIGGIGFRSTRRSLMRFRLLAL